jgi:hypothetical protein
MASNYESLLHRDCVDSSCKAVPSYHEYRLDVNATHLTFVPHIGLIIARQYVHIPTQEAIAISDTLYVSHTTVHSRAALNQIYIIQTGVYHPQHVYVN